MDFLLEALFGFLLGTLGAVPFLHTNTILSWLPSASPLIAVTLAFSHSVFEAVPTVFFGIPTADQGITALPAHKMVKEGRGRTAFFAVLFGLLIGIAGAVLLAPVFFTLWPPLFSALKPYTGWLLAAVALAAWISDGAKPLHALSFFGFGALGAAVFSLPLKEPLFPLLSGLFGVPALLVAAKGSFSAGGEMPEIKPSAAAGPLLGAFSVLLPALSPSFVSAFVFLFFEPAPEQFILLASALASSKLFFDFSAAIALNKARSAPAAIWREADVGIEEGILLLAIGVLAFLAACAIIVLIWRKIAPRLEAVSSRKASAALLVLVSAGAIAANGPIGLFVLAWAACASLASLEFGVPRKYALGCLMVPAMMHAFGI